MSYDLWKWTCVPDILGVRFLLEFKNRFVISDPMDSLLLKKWKIRKKGSLPWQCHPFVLLTEMICSNEKWRHQHWFSFNVIHVRRLLSVARFCSENRWSKILFLNPFPEKKLNWWISKMRIRIWSEESTHSVDYKDSWSVFGFAQKQAKSSLNSEIPIWIFLKKLTLKLR